MAYRIIKKEKRIVYEAGSLTEQEEKQVKDFVDGGYTRDVRKPKIKSEYYKDVYKAQIETWINEKSPNKKVDWEEYQAACNEISERNPDTTKGFLGGKTWFKNKYPKEYEELKEIAKKTKKR